MPLLAPGTGQRVYATAVELGAYLDDEAAVPADADRQLLRASEVVDEALLTATYTVDTDGLPTDSAVIAALRDATCAQVEFWLAGDEEDDIAGPVQGLQVGGLQVQYGAGSNRAAPLHLAPRAVRHLRACSYIRF